MPVVDGRNPPRKRMTVEEIAAMPDGPIKSLLLTAPRPKPDGCAESVLVCQACAGDAHGGKCKNPRCIGGPIVEEVPDGVTEGAKPDPTDAVQRLLSDARSAMIRYGTACLQGNEEGIRSSTTDACAALDRLAALAYGVTEAGHQTFSGAHADDNDLSSGQAVEGREE